MEKHALRTLTAGCYLFYSHHPFEHCHLTQWTFAKKTARISLETQLIPFLSLKDNLLLGVNKKRQPLFVNYFQQSQLPLTLLEHPIKQLSKLEHIQFQIIKQLLLQKNCLIIDHCDEALSVKETQLFLAFCREIAHTYQVSLILISADEQLTQTPYLEPLI
jgi:ABC-type sugar transport system, ATPase component